MHTYDYNGSGVLYAPAKGDYELVNWVAGNQYYHYLSWASYDNNVQKFIHLEPGNNPFVHDKITYIDPNEGTTEGQVFIAGGLVASSWMKNIFKVIRYNPTEKKAYLYTLNVNTLDPWNNPTPDVSLTFLGNVEGVVNENTVTDVGENSYYWYIGTDNKLFRMGVNGGESLLLATLPEGVQIKKIRLYEGESILSVGVYDPASTDEYKGSILTIKADDGTILEEHSNVCGKPVDILIK